MNEHKTKVSRVWIAPQIAMLRPELRVDLSNDYHVGVPLPSEPRELVEALRHAALLIERNLQPRRPDVVG